MSDKPAPSQPFIAYELYPATDYRPEPAPIEREWMETANVRFPYRCLPLVIANQAGWVLRSPATFEAYWYGGPNKEDVEIRFAGHVDNRITSHFGVGTVTFTIPFLFRTPPGINLWVKGPTNWIKDGVQPLEGIVEADWLVSTFTMNWKITRVCEWIRFDKGEPFCMLVPIPRGLSESLAPKRVSITSDPETEKAYRLWEKSRSGFLTGLGSRDPDALKKGWQKDYFQGKRPDGTGEFEEHQTKLNLREFARDEAPPPEG
jgi:hypothetical protein